MGKQRISKIDLEASRREANRRARDEARRRTQAAGKAPPCSQPTKPKG